MFEELDTASEQLRIALERYLHICSKIQVRWLQGAKPRRFPPGYAQRVDRELVLVDAYSANIQQARLAIQATHNLAFSVAPINSLPLEILTYIFHLVRDAEPGDIDHLPLVCSRWRSVALRAYSLWSHIEYRRHSTKGSGCLTRAQLYASRSVGVPLHFYLSVESEVYKNSGDDNPVESLCKLVAPRMKSLDLDLEYLYEWGNGRKHRLLSTLFSNCAPGMLTELFITDPDHFGFLVTKDETSTRPTFKIQLNSSELDNIFASITVLHLTGLFPLWSSRAYHGLVDLRLYASCAGNVDDDDTIPEQDLVGMLKACPGLRIFQFELQVTHRTRKGLSAPRVRLPDLEVLQVETGYGDPSYRQVEDFLRLIEPGPKPLQLRIRHDLLGADLGLTTETKAFLSRSNVTKLYAEGVPRFLELLSSLPYLKVLVLSDHGHRTQSNLPVPNALVTYPQLDMCFLSGCLLPLDQLIELVQRCQLQTLDLDDSNFYQDDPDEWVDIITIKKELLLVGTDIRLASTCPSLSLVGHGHPFHEP